MFKTVLFAVDGSPESQKAIPMVARLVQKFNSRLEVLSVLERGERAGKTASPESLQTLLQEVGAYFMDRGIPVEVMEREGNPPFVICDVAEETGAELIIMGCRGLGLTGDRAAQSVSTRVISLAACPVLTVP
ncbi:universal stress protein [Anthocerotibacter panamensis]|uniref:universal stress protein n=1 Tax=Anthocerotibacter panamensis TaxID=2857077 RepID=UPI001C406F08|nr:universal stress protein [Anthocerotibacter panamensis]